MLARWRRERGESDEIRHLRLRIAELEAQTREQGREVQRLNKLARFFRDATEATLDGLALFATNGSVLLWNAGLERITGWTAADVATDTAFLDRIAIDVLDRAEKQAWWRDLVTTVGVVQQPLRMLTQSGEVREFSVRFERRPGGLLLHVTDDAAIAAAQTALANSESRYGSLAERLGVGLYSIDDDAPGRFSSVNPEFARMLGYDSTDAALAGNPLDHHVVTEAGKAPVEAFSERVGPDGCKIIRYETQLRRADGGEPIWALVTVTVTSDEHQPYGRQDGVVLDISARRSAARALADSERRFRALFEQSVVGIAESDADQKLLRVNPAFCRFVGRHPSELIGKRDADLTHAGDVEREQELIAALKKGSSDLVELEKRYVRGNGAVVWGQVTLCIVKRDSGAGQTLVAMVQDITERKRHDAQREEAARLASLGTLAGGIAHNFNNILTAIVGNLSLARCGKPDAIDARLERAEEATWRAQQLTQQLLTFAKGGDPIVTSAVLSKLVRTSAELCLAGKPVAWTLAVEEADEWPVAVDANQIDQVLNNLLINAEQAMPAGGTVAIQIENVQLERGAGTDLRPGRYLRCQIADQGVGISEEDGGRVFEPYFSTKPGGTGLGLAASFSIVQRHEGQIHFTSEVGVGTVFTILLPAATEAPVELPKRRAPRIAQGRVLVMDDEAAIRATATEMLKEHGYEVMAVADGASAVAAWQQALEEGRPFALAIMDLTIPGGMGGAAALTVIRARDPGVRAVVCSGYSDSPVLADWRSYGFVGCVAKPYGVQRLLEAVAEAIAAPSQRG